MTWFCAGMGGGNLTTSRPAARQEMIRPNSDSYQTTIIPFVKSVHLLTNLTTSPRPKVEVVCILRTLLQRVSSTSFRFALSADLGKMKHRGRSIKALGHLSSGTSMNRFGSCRSSHTNIDAFRPNCSRNGRSKEHRGFTSITFASDDSRPKNLIRQLRFATIPILSHQEFLGTCGDMHQ